jgi:Lon protease-like protein
MFPLGTVLVPGAGLPLHVFEPRYRALMQDCLAGEPSFGVVLIERGSEVGGNDERFGVGTVARIHDAAELPDGRWVLVATGTHRFCVERWLPDDPYPLAEVRRLAEPDWHERDRPRLEQATSEVRRALAYAAELGEATYAATFDLPDDAALGLWQLVAMAPIGPVDKQRLLEIAEHGPRLDQLVELVREEAAILAYRLGG